MIKKIPPIKSQKGIERQYQKQLNKLGKALALGVREQVLNYLKAQQSSYVMDGFGDQLGVIFKKLNSIFTGVATASFAETTASQMVQKVGAASKNRFNRAVARATGIDLGSVIATEGLEDFVAVSTNKNVSLIKSLPEEYLKQVETIVNNGVVSGARYSTIEKEIISKTGTNSKLANRIKTIARNEVQTINSQIILRRSESLGITKGIYKSSKDERVRKSHAELDGDEFELKKGAWSKTAQKFIQPGITDINCRCTYSPIIKVDEEPVKKSVKKPVKKPVEKTVEKTETGKTKINSEKIKAENLSASTAERLVKKIDQSKTEDFALKDMLEKSGADGLPTVLSEKDFAKESKKNKKVMFRATGRPKDVQDLISGEKYHIGKGVDGNGTYAAATKNLSDEEIANALAITEDYGESVVRMTFKKDANIIDYTQAKRKMVLDKNNFEASRFNIAKSLSGEKLKEFNQATENILKVNYSDLGRWALSNDYDAILDPNAGFDVVDYTVILNRSAIIIDENIYSREELEKIYGLQAV